MASTRRATPAVGCTTYCGHRARLDDSVRGLPVHVAAVGQRFSVGEWCRWIDDGCPAAADARTNHRSQSCYGGLSASYEFPEAPADGEDEDQGVSWTGELDDDDWEMDGATFDDEVRTLPSPACGGLRGG